MHVRILCACMDVPKNSRALCTSGWGFDPANNIYIYMCVCVCMCVCMWMYMLYVLKDVCVCVCVCVCVHENL
jgi:hypothetical protein